MCHADNKKWEKRNNGRNRTAKIKKELEVWREELLQVFNDVRSRHHQTSRNERKNKSTPNERENFEKPNFATEISSKG